MQIIVYYMDSAIRSLQPMRLKLIFCIWIWYHFYISKMIGGDAIIVIYINSGKELSDVFRMVGK